MAARKSTSEVGLSKPALNQQSSRYTHAIRLPALQAWLVDQTPWLLLLVVPLLIFPRGPWPWIGLILVMGGWLLRLVAGRWRMIYTGLEPSLVLLAGMAVLGCSISIDRSLSVLRFWSLILGFLVFIEFVQVYRAPRQARYFTAFLMLSTLGVVGLTLVGADWHSARLFDPFHLYRYLPNLIRGLPGSGIANNDLLNLRWLGITLGFLIPVPLAVLLWGEGLYLRLACGITVVLASMMLLLTQALQGLFGLAAGIFFLLVWRWRWLAWVGLGGVILSAALFFVLRPWPMVIQVLDLRNFVGQGVNLRLDIWSRGWAMFRDMPFTGIGLNTFPLQIKYFYPGYSIGDEPHAHQLYLQTALDLGLPGLLAFLWGMILWFLRLSGSYRQTQDRLARALYLGLAAGAIAYLAHGFMDALMLGAKPGVLLWAMLGLGAARPLTGKKETLKDYNNQVICIWSSFLPFFVVPIGLLSILVIRPTILEMNIAALQAHRMLVQDAGNVSIANSNPTVVFQRMQRLANQEPDNRTANELAGRLLLRDGSPEQAAEYFYRVVNLDRQEIFQEFYPPFYLVELLTEPDHSYIKRLEDLSSIYSCWFERYPHQAEYYLLSAILNQKFLRNPDQALQILEQGNAHQAQPVSALEYYRNQIAP